MKYPNLAILTCLLISQAILNISCNRIEKNDYPIRPVPFTDVIVTDDFWATRMKTNREVTVPYALEKVINDGRLGDDTKFADRFMDVYKVVEGTSYTLHTYPDPELENYLDSIIWLIGLAQEEDGYIYRRPRIGQQRWVSTHTSSHELYNMGLLYEAAIAHFELTGKMNLLDIAIKNADLVIKETGPGRFETYPGHQAIEMALSRLYRLTGDRRYLEQAKYFLDARGIDSVGRPPHLLSAEKNSYNQTHLRVVEQSEAAGHAVRALYMYAGMADVAALTDDSNYIRAIDLIWDDITRHKFYITGGIGSRGGNEGFDDPYDLPNRTAYCETCAGVANVFWNQRMFLLHGDAKYIDVLERSLYNNVLSGVSLEGDRFFYTNRLESDERDTRREWFTWSCCPTNLVRLIPSVPGYIYAYDSDNIYVNLYVSSETSIELKGGNVALKQESGFPWEGNVKLELDPGRAVEFTLRLRIPGWAGNQPVPGDLYTFTDVATDQTLFKINGEEVPVSDDKGYAVIRRLWKQGDILEFDIPMEARFIRSHPKVAANAGRLALQKGPLVYCAEWADFGENQVNDIVLQSGSTMIPDYRPDLLDGITVLTGNALVKKSMQSGDSIMVDIPFTSIPYYARAHRGPGPMSVWLKEN